MTHPAARLLPRPLRLGVSRAMAGVDSRRLRRSLAALASRGGPIVAGPWLGEVGFELLYWAPFVAWFQRSFAVEPSRLLVISRGGTAAWYPQGVRYADVLDHVPPEAFRAAHARRVREVGEQKQLRETAFEREVVTAMAAAAGAGGAPLLHPSRMYRVLRPFWWGHLGTDWVHRHAHYRRLAPPGEAVPGLPPAYTAVKFYFNDCFPRSDRNVALARAIVADLADRGPVVSLSAGPDLDDHGSCPVEARGVTHVPLGISPARNLQLQSAVVAGASRFVGTYGGFAYLAPFHGVPSTSYFSIAGGFAPSHLRMARSALETIGAGGLLEALPLRPDAPVVQPMERHEHS